MAKAKKKTKNSKPEEPCFEGRPTLYKPEMIGQAKAYIKNCPDFVPSLVGLAMELEIGLSTIKAWKALNPKDLDLEKYPHFEKFQDLLERLHNLQERSALNGGAEGKWNSTIAKLILAKHDYAEKQETEITGKDGGPIPVQIIDYSKINLKDIKPDGNTTQP